MGRKKRRKRKPRRILILCEDTKSARSYLARFPHDPEQVEIECIGTGANTDSLMGDAIKRTKDARNEGVPYERVWVVFDKDSFPLQNFNRAFDLARHQKEITPCWSNECFEIWYLLHFHYRETEIGREQLFKKVSGLLKRKYNKGNTDTYGLLYNKLNDALRNARKLAFENELNVRRTDNPSTHAHELVNALLQFAPDLQRQ